MFQNLKYKNVKFILKQKDKYEEKSMEWLLD